MIVVVFVLEYVCLCVGWGGCFLSIENIGFGEGKMFWKLDCFMIDRLFYFII